MTNCVGMDLHSTNTVLGMVDEDGKRIYRKKIPNHYALISKELQPFKKKTNYSLLVEILGKTIEPYNALSNYPKSKKRMLLERTIRFFIKPFYDIFKTSEEDKNWVKSQRSMEDWTNPNSYVPWFEDPIFIDPY